MSYSLMLGLVTLGSFLQEGSGTTAVSREFCQPFHIVKTYNLRDPVTNQSCTLEIPTIICGGFCASDFALMGLEYDESTTGAYKLVRTSTDADDDCKCCEALHTPLLYDAPPMALTCLEGQKWNYIVKLLVPTSRNCTCRTCNHGTLPDTNHMHNYIWLQIKCIGSKSTTSTPSIYFWISV